MTNTSLFTECRFTTCVRLSVCFFEASLLSPRQGETRQKALRILCPEVFGFARSGSGLWRRRSAACAARARRRCWPVALETRASSERARRGQWGSNRCQGHLESIFGAWGPGVSIGCKGNQNENRQFQGSKCLI